MASKEVLLYKLAIAREAKLHDDVIDIMKQIVHRDDKLKNKQLLLLHTSLQTKVKKIRFAWRILKEKQRTAPPATTNLDSLSVIDEYLRKIEKELKNVCAENIDLYKNLIIGSCNSVETLVWGQRIIGDNYRYVATISTGEQRLRSIRKAYEYYKKAMQISEMSLTPSNPVYLRVVLNTGLLMHSVMGESKMAIRLTQKAYLKASDDASNIQSKKLYEVSKILKNFRDKWQLWTKQLEEEPMALENCKLGNSLEMKVTEVSSDETIKSDAMDSATSSGPMQSKISRSDEIEDDEEQALYMELINSTDDDFEDDEGDDEK